MVPATLGTDTGCSVVNPSAMCGVSGVKGTYGRCSRHGVISLAWSCDHAGPMARRMADCALLLGVMAGHDKADPTSLHAPVPTYPTAPRRPRGGADRSAGPVLLGRHRARHRTGVPRRIGPPGGDGRGDRGCSGPAVDGRRARRRTEPLRLADPAGAGRAGQDRAGGVDQLSPAPGRQASPPLLTGDPRRWSRRERPLPPPTTSMPNGSGRSGCGNGASCSPPIASTPWPARRCRPSRPTRPRRRASSSALPTG